MLDESRYWLRVAKELGVTAMELPAVPLHLRTAAMVELEVRGIVQRREAKRAATRGRKR